MRAGRAGAPGEAVIDVWDIVEQLAGRGEPAPTVVAFEGVGHEIGYAPPGTGGAGPAAGRDPDATGLASARAWNGVLDYLQDL